MTAKFQSTRPRGTRRIFTSVPALLFVSIHASARDATAAEVRPAGGTMFQSTRPRGTRHPLKTV